MRDTTICVRAAGRGRGDQVAHAAKLTLGDLERLAGLLVLLIEEQELHLGEGRSERIVQVVACPSDIHQHAMEVHEHSLALGWRLGERSDFGTGVGESETQCAHHHRVTRLSAPLDHCERPARSGLADSVGQRQDVLYAVLA